MAAASVRALPEMPECLMEHMESRMQDHYEAMDRRWAELAEEIESKVRERIAAWMMERGYATGHGDTIEGLLVELEGHAKSRALAQHYGDQP